MVVNIIMECIDMLLKVKDFLEIVYYIAFILLTWKIVCYAKKTYDDQTKQTSNILLKFSIPYDQLGLAEQMVFLELYNHGTRPAIDIAISIGENEIVQIDYISPKGRELLPIGEVIRTLGCNRVTIQNKEIDSNASVCITIKENGEFTEHKVNTSTLFIRSEVIRKVSL